ncbi:MAG: hypothetical protein AAFS12_00050 [Cyanobacteria bacterium J06632_19]
MRTIKPNHLRVELDLPDDSFDEINLIVYEFEEEIQKIRLEEVTIFKLCQRLTDKIVGHDRTKALPTRDIKTLKQKGLALQQDILAVPEQSPFSSQLLVEINATSRAFVNALDSLDGVNEKLLDSCVDQILSTKDLVQKRILVSEKIKLIWISLFIWFKS